MADAKFRFSYSSKRDLTLCPHRFELIYVKKVPVSVELRRFISADSLDIGFTKWVKVQFTGSLVNICVEVFEKIAAKGKVIWLHPFDKREHLLLVREAAHSLEVLMQQNNMCRLTAVSQFKAEVIVGEIELVGRLDLFYPEEMEIYDLKTTRNSIWLDTSQLNYYDFIVSVMMGRKVKKVGFLAPLMDNKVQTWEVSKEHWSKVINEINEGIRRVAAGDYPAIGDEKKDCYTCLVKRFCKKYRPVVPVTRKNNVMKASI